MIPDMSEEIISPEKEHGDGNKKKLEKEPSQNTILLNSEHTLKSGLLNYSIKIGKKKF